MRATLPSSTPPALKLFSCDMDRSELSVARESFSDIDVHKRRPRAMPGNYGRNWLIASEGNTEQLTILVQACLNTMINLAEACCCFASERVPQYTYAGQIQMFKEDAVLLPGRYFELIQGKLSVGGPATYHFEICLQTGYARWPGLLRRLIDERDQSMIGPNDQSGVIRMIKSNDDISVTGKLFELR